MDVQATPPFFTIGHSTRPVPEFVEMLRRAEVRLVVDVRTVPVETAVQESATVAAG